ncbi:MAG: OmpA family protein [Saprospiraceae bacterium]
MKRWIGLIAFSFLLVVAGFGQKKTLKKANELFKNGAYAEALPLYQEVLEEEDSRLAKTKLAYCFKMNNRLDEAEALYATLVEDKHSPDITLFYYGEALMSNEKYDEAKLWFEKYLAVAPDSENAPLLIKACEEVKTIKPYFNNIRIFEFTQNTTADDNSPVFWNNKVVFTSDRKAGIQLLKQKSGWTGREYLRLYESDIQADGNFTEPKAIDKLNEMNKNTTNASFDTLNKLVYFTKNSNETNKQNTYNLQLYKASYDKSGNWKNVEKLAFCHLGSNYMHPAVSPDGELLFYVADKASGEGGTDIFMSTKKKNGEWAPGQNLGPNINSPANEGFPFYDGKGNLYFCSKGHVGYGGFDIFVSTQQKNGIWSKPLNLGKPINSAQDDISIYMDLENNKGLFTSARSGGDDDIFIFYLPDSNGSIQNVPEPLLLAEMTQQPKENVKTETTVPTKKEEILVDNSESKVLAPEVSQEELEESFVETQVSNNDSKTEEEIVVKEEAFGEVRIDTETPETNNPPKEEIEIPLHIEENNQKPEISLHEMEKKKIGELEEMNNEVVEEESKKKRPLLTEAELAKFNEKEEQPIALPATFNEKALIKVPVEDETTLVKLAWNAVLEPNQRFVLSHIKFGNGEYELNSQHKMELDKLASFLNQYQNLRVEIGAHNMAMEDENENQTISRYRAETSMAYLIEKGIPNERIQAKGYGTSLLLNNCKKPEDCAIKDHLKNQRLEVKILETGY